MLSYFKRNREWKNMDRIGPDCPNTHKMLFSRKKMIKLCKLKFKSFAESAEFRPFAYAHCPSTITIGERVVIRPGTVLSGDLEAEIIIEDDVLIGMGVHIYVDNHNFTDTERPIIEQGYFPSKTVRLEKGCWIGANVVILPGVIIGANSVIGAGSIVTKSVPPKVVFAGNPAQEIRKVNN